MADTKIKSLGALTTTPAPADVFPMVDDSDTSMAASGTTKKVPWSVIGPPLPTLRPEDFGAVGDDSTDDTTAFRSMMAAVDTTKGAEIILTPGKSYVLDSAPITTGSGNAIVPLPLVGNALGTDSTYPFGLQQPQIVIRSLFGQARIRSTRTTDTYSATYGSPSIIGGPTPEVVGSAAEMASIGTVSVEGVVFQTPANPKISALDLWYSRRMDVKNVAFVTDETWDGTASSVTAPTNVFNFALRASYHYGQTRIIYDGVHIAGYYCGVVVPQSHNVWIQCIITFCNIAMGLDEVTADSDNHPSTINYLVTHHCIYGIGGWDPVSGAKSLAATNRFHIYGGPWDIEHSTSPWSATQDVLDANNQIYGHLTYHKWPIGTALLVSGATNWSLVDGREKLALDKPIDDLTALAGTSLAAADDQFVVWDDSAAETKKINAASMGMLGSAVMSHTGPMVSVPASVATGGTNTYYAIRIRLASHTTVTGVRYRVGATANGTVSCALFDGANSTQYSIRTTPASQATANTVQAVGFDSAFTAATATDYIALLWFSSATATFWGARFIGGVVTGTNATTAPATISNPSQQNIDVPIMALY